MGRQVFTAGEILTAANMNDLSDQTVMVFDDATARTTAIPTPVEGMVTYLKDTDAVEKFDGSAFVNVDTGGLIAVKSAIFTGTQVVNNPTVGGSFAITDLSITHEVANVANKLIISAFIGAAGHANQRGNVGLAVHDGTNLIAIASASGSKSRVTAGGDISPTNSEAVVTMPSVTFVHIPGAGSKTYTLHAVPISTGSSTTVINRRQSENDNLGTARAVSSLVIQEVAV